MYILYIVFVQIDCCIWGLDYVFGGGGWYVYILYLHRLIVVFGVWVHLK